ncbi:MAG TPA: mechanosensitive ion channel domain-containing protein [Micavibrio sp.]|nr:mechanosensitive ion channel domain-containing protein [Micavibrio sp.]
MSASKAPADAAPDIIPNIDLDLEEIKSGAFLQHFGGLEDMLMEMGITWGVRLIVAIVILILGWTVGNWIDRRVNRLRRLDGTLKNFLGGLFKYTIITVAVVTVIGLFGIPMASLLAVIGAAGLAIGLALQGTLSNIASGVMLLILRPFNVGDYIEFGSESGTVKTLGLFGTELAKADNVYLFAPNSRIWGNEIVNYSRNPYRRQDIVVSIDYNDDVDKAMSILDKILNSDERILQEDGRQPQVVADKLNDFTIDLIARFWSLNSDYWELRWDTNKRIKQELEAAGISLTLVPRQMGIAQNDGKSETHLRKDGLAKPR